MKIKLLLSLAWCVLAFGQAGITEVTVSAGATPTLTTTAGVTNFTWTLTANVTSSTFSSAAPGIGSLKLCEDSSGGWTVVFPANFVNFRPLATTAANYCQYYTWKYDGTNVTATSQSQARTASVTDLAPVATDSGLVLLLNPTMAVHLTRVFCAVQGSTNVVLNLDKRTEAAIGTDSGAHLLGSDLTAVAGGANTSTFANGSAQCGGTSSCAIAAHTPVVVTITGVSGTPTALNCSVDYTVD